MSSDFLNPLDNHHERGFCWGFSKVSHYFQFPGMLFNPSGGKIPQHLKIYHSIYIFLDVTRSIWETFICECLIV